MLTGQGFLEETQPDLSAIQAVLAPGATVRAAVTGAGIVSLQIRGHDGRTLTALAERGALAGGEVVTLRLADATIVWFVQLGVRSVQGSEVGRDLVELGLGGLLAVPSERWAERAAYDGRLEVRSGGAAVAGRVRDISPLGIGFTLPEPALEGDALELSVELPDGARVPLRARVLRAVAESDGAWHVAAEIVALAPSDWERLERVLAGPARG